LTTKFTQLTSAFQLIQCLVNFMMLFVPAHRSLRLLRTAEPQQESKALIKLTLCYSPCSYPMLFSCQKSPAFYGVPH
jgi:competence protein ComGF